MDYIIGNNTLKFFELLDQRVLPVVVNNRDDYDICNRPEVWNRVFCTNKMMCAWR